jgi:histidine triad (HIT) family protein
MQENCIFCKIAKGEVPAKVVYEDEHFLGVLDISPLNKGHVQLIPKTHYRWTWDVPNFGSYWEAAKKVAQAQMKGMGAKMVEFLTHGMEVEHAHIWIVPIYGSEAFIDVSKRKEFSEEEMTEAKDLIIKNI